MEQARSSLIHQSLDIKWEEEEIKGNRCLRPSPPPHTFFSPPPDTHVP